MAKRKRLEPARLTDLTTVADMPEPTARASLATRPPIADVAQDASASAALAEVAAELTAARTQGRLIQNIPLAAVKDDYLVRDRTEIDAYDMDTLITSLKARGQQTPIEVADLGGGHYGLISGWRRVTALRKIEVLWPELDTVMAIIRVPKDAADAYVAMVEENEIRSGLSFYERARIVVRAVDEGVYRNTKSALSGLFGSIPRARRSKIRSFVEIVQALDGDLQFPAALSEKQGLTLAKALRERSGYREALQAALRHAPPQSPSDEALMIDAPVTSSDSALALDQSATIPPLVMTQKDGKLIVSGTRLQDPNFVTRAMAAIEALE